MDKLLLVNLNQNKKNTHLSISFKNIILFTIKYPITSDKYLFEKCKESGISSILFNKYLYTQTERLFKIKK